jgi:hypothetical protein
MRQSGADEPIVAMKRSNVRGAKGFAHSRQNRCGQLRKAGGTEWLWRRPGALPSEKSRVNRKVYARFCEGLGVKFPGPTRLVLAAFRVRSDVVVDLRVRRSDQIANRCAESGNKRRTTIEQVIFRLVIG